MEDKKEPWTPLLVTFPDSEKLNSVSEGAENLYLRLLARSDDLAHYFGDPKMILGKLYTTRWANGEIDVNEVENRVLQLKSVDLIKVYDISGKKYIEIVNCKKLLRSDLKKNIQYPTPLRFDSDTDSTRNSSETPPPTSFRQIHSTPLHSTPENTMSVSTDAVRGSDNLPPGFVEFWKAWPRHFRKQGRGECLRIWKRTKLEPIAEQIVACVNRCKNSTDWKKEDGAFIPMPVTWLHRTPWETDSSEMVCPTPASESTFSEHFPKPDPAEVEREMKEMNGGNK